MKRIAFILSMIIVLASCQNRRETPLVDREITIEGLSKTEWTYFSFEKGEVVGRSSFLSAEEDALWAERLDWDFAICGDRIKTNGGDSGKGLGGVYKNTTQNYYQIETAHSGAYQVDSLQTVYDY